MVKFTAACCWHMDNSISIVICLPSATVDIITILGLPIPQLCLSYTSTTELLLLVPTGYEPFKIVNLIINTYHAAHCLYNQLLLLSALLLCIFAHCLEPHCRFPFLWFIFCHVCQTRSHSGVDQKINLCCLGKGYTVHPEELEALGSCQRGC